MWVMRCHKAKNNMLVIVWNRFRINFVCCWIMFKLVVKELTVWNTFCESSFSLFLWNLLQWTLLTLPGSSFGTWLTWYYLLIQLIIKLEAHNINFQQGPTDWRTTNGIQNDDKMKLDENLQTCNNWYFFPIKSNPLWNQFSLFR